MTALTECIVLILPMLPDGCYLTLLMVSQETAGFC